MSEGNDDTTRTSACLSPAEAPTEPATPPSTTPAPGDRLGRYVLGGVIGRGGMGVVFRASDPELRRDVAIKVLLPSRASHASKDRLLEEARAMAKLRHPAVLPVFDVGSTVDGVFLAMPLVDGGTLRDWLAREKRSWKDVVEKFLAAGRGLAAAHDAGLVHRDFKPTNVLLEADGRVQVADFGIASLEERSDGDAETSSVAGTPAYMAPEQASGKPVDARADQFSYCVSFWEGVYGERPLDAETETKRTPLQLDGALSRGARDTAVPTWLRAALLRGLAFRPDDRWPSLEKLLAEIENRARPRRGMTPWIVATAAVVGLGAVLAFIATRDEDKKPKVSEPLPAPAPTLVLDSPTQLTALGECAANPSFAAPDVITFDVSTASGVDLYSLNIAERRIARLTDEGRYWEWRSRPGRRPDEIVYLGTSATELTDSYLGFFDLGSHKETDRIRALAGGVGVLGDEVYYADINGAELHRSRGTEDTIVATYEPGSIASFALEPASKRIAYVSSRGGPVCHHVIGRSDNPVCSKLKTATHAPAFADKGRSIYVGNSNGVLRIDVTSGEETSVLDTSASGGVAISPDEKTVVYSNCRPTMKIVDLSTSPPTVVVESTSARSPALSSTGYLAWVQTVDGVSVLMLRSPDGAERQLTSKELGNVATPSIDSTGSNVVFQVKGENPGVYVATLDRVRTVVTRFTTDVNDRAPTWFSPSGVAFERQHKNGPSTTHIIDTATGNVTEVADANAFMTSNPRTGELLMLTQAKAQPFLWLNPKTGKKRRGPRGGPSAYSWAWVSPDGKWLSVKAGAGGAVWRAKIPDGDMALVSEKHGLSLADCAIDDRGHIIATPIETKGELFAATVKSGSL